jgi:hypothetical protein
MTNIYYQVHFMVCESYGHNNIINNVYPILGMVNKIRKEIVNESIR